VILLVSAVFWVQTLTTRSTTSQTFDEAVHLAAGYAQLTEGSAALNVEHPPLVKLIAAAALWPKGGTLGDVVPDWRGLAQFEVGRRFLYGGGRDADALLNRARLGPILIGFLLCVTVLGWALRLYGAPGGLFSFALIAMSPTIIAHGRLVTNDVGVAAFGVLAAYLTWRVVDRPSLRGALFAGLALGATAGSKFSGVVFFPAVLASVGASVWWARRTGRPTPSRGVLIKVGAVMSAGAGLFIIALYGWPPDPAAFVRGLSHIGYNHEQGFEFYLLGEYQVNGFATYFPTALALKSTPVELLCTLSLPAVLLMHRRRAGTPAAADVAAPVWPFLVIPPLAHLAFMSAVAPQIGVRYVIPVLAFAIIGAGALARYLWPSRVGRAIVLALVAGQAVATVQSRSDPISYVNGLFGCRPAPIKCLDDSNVDWGQDLRRVATTVASMQTPGDTVVVMAFTSADLNAYFRQWREMQDPDEILRPGPHLYAVSLHLLNSAVASYGRQNDADWYAKYKPAATVGNTYVIYDFRQKKNASR
jgi:hypothetical protein